MTVTNASENVLAVDELLSKERERVVFGKDGSFLEYKHGKRYPLPFDQIRETLVDASEKT